MDGAELCHSLCSADRSQHAAIGVDKQWPLVRSEVPIDEVCNIPPLLHCHRSHSRQRLPIVPHVMCCITDDEDPRIVGNRQILSDLDPTKGVLWS